MVARFLFWILNINENWEASTITMDPVSTGQRIITQNR